MTKFDAVMKKYNNTIGAESWNECVSALMEDENMTQFEAEIMLEYDCKNKTDVIDWIQAAVTHKRYLHIEYAGLYDYFLKEHNDPELAHLFAKEDAQEMAWHWVHGERAERDDYDTMSLEECTAVLRDDYIGKLDKADHSAWMAA